ncbi:MAG: hypothetical protein ABGX71_11400 [Methyloprofundus sp.]|nr:hypothetical protein [Methylococcales bacterium]
MKQALLGISILAAISATNVLAISKVSDESSFNAAIDAANLDNSINKIVFEKNAQLSLSHPVIYTGNQDLMLFGNGATIDGENAGSFTLDNELLASTEDGTLIFNTQGNITIQQLSIVNSATRGLVINIPQDAQGDDIQISLDAVDIHGSALYGLHIDDNADKFDDGEIGSAIGIELNISDSSFKDNGIGAIDFDGIRVDERGQGDIHATIINTHIDGNGGDGLELDEAGRGSVDAKLQHVTFNDNGFYNEDDLDDGFDIDERGAGDIEVSLFKVLVNRNKDEGLDFDEAGSGDVKIKLQRVIVMGTVDEGIKIDEHGEGNIETIFSNVMVMDGGDDGIQVTEQGNGHIESELQKVSAINNNKSGVKIEQWFEKDEKLSVEKGGALHLNKLALTGNGSELQLHNVNVE